MFTRRTHSLALGLFKKPHTTCKCRLDKKWIGEEFKRTNTSFDDK
jgi:hypothetical protein